jgi:hypothetical protein
MNTFIERLLAKRWKGKTRLSELLTLAKQQVATMKIGTCYFCGANYGGTNFF